MNRAVAAGILAVALFTLAVFQPPPAYITLSTRERFSKIEYEQRVREQIAEYGDELVCVHHLAFILGVNLWRTDKDGNWEYRWAANGQRIISAYVLVCGEEGAKT